ncbi:MULTISPECIES: hypothetical protein [unclassified Corallococcus]|uniref:hypothetical protein n=1 Tax=unclassified Corallococcus TaxID=2685029 RepID=UPI001A8E0A43|nr:MULTISPECIES: hypothetical protein [unclassified Corallococcus]MBN9685398.1 hypothetical protein [Corallococcus sp. NCSPR001]WAS83151.1 hypothetical protein O0N60_28000 [Corallococcus sp. NCRR]
MPEPIEANEEIEVMTTAESGAAVTLRKFQPLPAPELALEPVTEPMGTLTTTTEAPAEEPRHGLVSKRVAAVLATLASVGAFLAGILPVPYDLALGVLAMALAAVAGVATTIPSITTGKPLVKASVAVPCLAVAGILAQFAQTLPDGPVRGFALAGAVGLFGLAGVPLPSTLGQKKGG